MLTEQIDGLVLWFAAGLVLAFVSLLPACQYQQPACTAIDIAHAACEYVTLEVRQQDGTVRTVRVPREDLERAALGMAVER